MCCVSHNKTFTITTNDLGKENNIGKGNEQSVLGPSHKWKGETHTRIRLWRRKFNEYG